MMCKSERTVFIQNIKHHPKIQIICSTLFELENHNIHTSVNSPANSDASSKNTTN